MRVLFFNEGNLGGYILGQEQLTTAIRGGLAAAPDVEASFDGLAPMGRVSSAIAHRPLPGLTAANLDFRTLRWHVVQSLRARRALARAIARERPDVVHLHSQSVALAAAPLMRATPFALSADTSIVDWATMPAWAPRRNGALALAPSRALERRALGAARIVLAWTSWARRGIERERPSANVVEHHPGLDLARYRPAPRAARERPRILFVGGRFAEKGGDDLLAALGPALGGEVELDVVTRSDVPPRPGLRVHTLSAGDADLVALYQQADLLCLPTHGDTNPWVLLEAMACATPVVATPVGAISEMLGDGDAGVLVPRGDRRTLGETMRALLADPARLAGLGARGRARCERHYDAARQLPRLLEYLRAIAGVRGDGA